MKNEKYSNVWDKGFLFAFSAIDGKTDYENGLVLRSGSKGCCLEFKLPVCMGILVFSDRPPHRVAFGGDFFEFETDAGTVRGVMPDSWHMLISGPCIPVGLPPEYAHQEKGGRTLFGVRSKFNETWLERDFEELFFVRGQWLESQTFPPDLPELRFRALSKAFSQLKTQINSPEGRIKHLWSTPDRWPHRNMWLWDSVFHALALRHICPEIAKETIRAVFDIQQDDGFIPHMASPVHVSKVTQPPVLGYGVKKILEFSDDLDFIREIYPKNALFLHWIMANRDVDGGGLVEWLVENTQNCPCAESGMDNSPRFDHEALLDATDFNAFLSQDCSIMEEFAERLGLEPDRRFWHDQNARLNELMNRKLWNEEAGFYLDCEAKSGRPVPVRASSGFMPLLCGCADFDKAVRMASLLDDPNVFGTTFPVPSIAADCPELYKKDMWRGPVWININYLAAEGFEKCGLSETAAMIRRKTIQEMEKFFARYGTFFEFYDDRGERDPPDLERKGCCDPEKSPYHQVFMDYGWSAALYIDIVLTNSKI